MASIHAYHLVLVVTTLVSYVASAVIAGGLYKIEERLRGLRRQHDDAEKMTMPVWPSSRHSERTPPPENRTALQHAGSPSESDAIGLPSTTAGFIARTVPVWISILLLVTIGIPVYRVTNYDMPFEAFYFTLSWAMALQLQRSVKKCKSLETWPRVRSTLAVILNPVLVTAGLGTAYFWAEAAVTHSSIDDVLSSFHRHDTWAEAMAGSIADRSAQRHVGAGDLSSALLDAGIVSLGPKMFEHRRALRASLATVVVASLALAVADALLGVAVARRLLAGAFPAHDDDDPGLPPAAAADALAFAARSVTVALGAPAVRCLGGSTMLMSALAVVGGMLWQAAGNTVLRWLGVRDRRGQQGSHSIWHGSGDAVRGNAGGAGGGGSRNRGNRQHGGNGGEPDDPEEEVDGGVDYKVIAAGVTVGVNAGVMGTAHLIERDSMATAHSALSMTIFGVFTVVLTSVPPFADVLTRLASR